MCYIWILFYIFIKVQVNLHDYQIQFQMFLELVQELLTCDLILFLVHTRHSKFSLKYAIYRSYFTYLQEIKSI